MPVSQGTFRRQAGTADLIQQGPVTDLEGAGGTLAIPPVGLKHAEDDLALKLVYGMACNFFQMDLAVNWNI